MPEDKTEQMEPNWRLICFNPTSGNPSNYANIVCNGTCPMPPDNALRISLQNVYTREDEAKAYY